MTSSVIALVLAFTALSVSAPHGGIYDDFRYLVNIFPGQYDNSLQVFEDLVIDLPPRLRHIRFSAEIFLEKISIFPSDVVTFYHQGYIKGDQERIVRQKIYAFQINSTNKDIITKFYSFVHPTKFVNAQNHPGIFNNLTWSELIYLPGCDIKWNRLQPDFYRTQPTDKCVISYNGTKFEIEDTNDLTSNYITVDEKWTFVSNGSVFRDGSPFNLTKLKVPEVRSRVKQQPISKDTTRQVNTFGEIIQALSQALPVTLYIDLPNCNREKSIGTPAGKFNIPDDFKIEAYSINIDTFEFFNSSVFGPMPYFGFTDAPIIRASTGDMFKLREGLLGSNGFANITVTWLNPANYSPVQKIVFSCRLKDATRGNSGQVTAVTHDVSLSMINNFGELKTAIQSGYSFRFYMRYLECTSGPKVNAFAGGIIEGMTIGVGETNATYSKSKLITNYQGSGYVTDIVTGTIHDSGFYATFVASDDYVPTFKRVYIEMFQCPISSSSSRGALDIYKYTN